MSMVVSGMLRLAPVFALLAFSAARPEPLRKCGSQAPGGMIYFVNGVAMPEFTKEHLAKLKDNIFVFDYLCMNPQDSTLNRSAGHHATVVWTNDGPGPHVLLALDHIRYVQDRHFKSHRKYIASAADIVMPQGMERVRVTLQGDERGWIAHTTIPRLMQTCTMFDGVVQNTSPASEPRRVACKFDERSTP